MLRGCSEFPFIKKKTLAQVFSTEFCEIFKNTFIHRTPLVAASLDVNVLNMHYIFPEPKK